MKTEHRGKAYLGMTIWGIFTLVLVVLGIGLRSKQSWAMSLSPEVKTAVIWITLVVPFVSFFWTAYHFALAKGQSTGLTLIGLLGPLTQLMAFAILISLPDKFATTPKRRLKKTYNSHAERLIDYRHKAFPRIVFGVSGIAFAIYISVVSRWFVDFENRLALGLVVFVVGYASVLSGCSYWATAKGWNNAIVFIALMPAAMIFVPGVRLIVLMLPLLLSISMVMMTIILVCIVAILPDKSGIPRRRKERTNNPIDLS